MFGRGTWAVLGLAKDSLEAFQTSLEDRAAMAACSQMAASAAARLFSADTLGVNPYSAPRLDEEHPLAIEHQETLAQYAITEHEPDSGDCLPEEILACPGYGFTAACFQLHETLPWYGLWAVSNEWKDVGDRPSAREQRSYALLERPYRFLQAIDKKSVDQETPGATAAVRKQVPVLLDFNEGRVYVESGNKKLIHAVAVRLQQLGAGIVRVAWTYDHPNWTAAILNRLYENTEFQADFIKRAQEATRFQPKEIEKLEDRELEGIVANYFSMTRLGSDFWAGISGPALIRLHDASAPVAVKAPASATTLLQMTSDARLLSGALTFQERVSFAGKDGAEHTFRKDLLSIDVNDRMNLTDAGAAMLRGFNLPSLRKDIQREIRQTHQVPSIQQFWGTWLHELSNAVRTIEAAFRELLDLDGDQAAGILPMKSPVVEEAPAYAGAPAETSCLST